MKRKNTTWIIELKDIKVRQPFAPLTKKFRDKTKYCRRMMKTYLD
jgi:hypothetical protein